MATFFEDMGDLGDAWSSAGGGGSTIWPAFDLGSSWTPDGGGLTIPPPVNMPSTGSSGIGGLFSDITNLISVAYQGQASLEQQKLQNKIAAAQLGYGLKTVQTAPNVWLVLGLGAAGLFALQLMDRRR